ncbi:MAG: Cro/Cl family transcriptional regulator [Planctomycetaceae bacterium]|nr:Cro/Cl family transcriptional regulator [Planctomycetaceae bacterium]
MQYSFRLAELLGHVPDPKKRPGTVKSIVEYTGLDRHQVSALLKNEVKYIPLKALSRLCDYLVEHGYATADQLPGALFAVESENFWELLARRQRIEICCGIRRFEEDADGPQGAWLVASDSLLIGELLNGISSLGGTSKMNDSEPIPHPELLQQSLVWSPSEKDQAEVFRRSAEVYDAFTQFSSDRGLIGLGSVKSNPVVEHIVATTFGCEPYKEQSGVAAGKDRSCPFMLRYRDDDLKPESCMAGTQLSKIELPTTPGIMYEKEDGTWDVARWNENTEDAAMVFYIHREALGRLEMVVGGFSGRATRMLARTLGSRGEDFWPPVYSGHGVQVGAFILQFSFTTSKQKKHDVFLNEPASNVKIIPLHQNVIARRLEK